MVGEFPDRGRVVAVQRPHQRTTMPLSTSLVARKNVYNQPVRRSCVNGIYRQLVIRRNGLPSFDTLVDVLNTLEKSPRDGCGATSIRHLVSLSVAVNDLSLPVPFPNRIQPARLLYSPHTSRRECIRVGKRLLRAWKTNG